MSDTIFIRSTVTSLIGCTETSMYSIKEGWLFTVNDSKKVFKLSVEGSLAAGKGVNNRKPITVYLNYLPNKGDVQRIVNDPEMYFLIN